MNPKKNETRRSSSFDGEDEMPTFATEKKNVVPTRNFFYLGKNQNDWMAKDMSNADEFKYSAEKAIALIEKPGTVTEQCMAGNIYRIVLDWDNKQHDTEEQPDWQSIAHEVANKFPEIKSMRDVGVAMKPTRPNPNHPGKFIQSMRIYLRTLAAEWKDIKDILIERGFKEEDHWDLGIYGNRRHMGCVNQYKYGDHTKSILKIMPCANEPRFIPVIQWLNCHLLYGNETLLISSAAKTRTKPGRPKQNKVVCITDDSGLIELLRKIIMGLHKKRADDYNECMRVIFAITNITLAAKKEINESREVAHEFAQRSHKYDPNWVDEKVDTAIGNYTTRDENDKVKMGTLVEWLREDNEDCYRELILSYRHLMCLPGSYEYVKHEFEQECFKIRNPVCFGITRDNITTFKTEAKLREAYRELKFTTTEMVNNKSIQLKKSFIKEWLDDENKKIYETMTFDPSESHPPNVYNTFPGYAAAKIPEIPNDQVSEFIEPILRHFKEVICDNKATNVDFIVKWLACMIQRPNQKTGVAILLHGPQGCGKNTNFDGFRKFILGDALCKQTATPHIDLFDKFSNGARERLFIQIDEANGRDLMGNNDKLKNFITAETIRFEEKGVMTIDVPNLTNIVFTTNNQNPIPLSHDDRRFVAFQCSAKYVGNKEYFDKLHSHWQRPEVARAFYQYLKDIVEISDVTNFQSIRPVTSYYRDLQRMNLSSFDRYLTYYVHSDGAKIVKAITLYNEYKTWCQMRNLHGDISSSMFGRKIREISGIEVKRTNIGIQYELNMSAIRQFLQENHRWDEEVF